MILDYRFKIAFVFIGSLTSTQFGKSWKLSPKRRTNSKKKKKKRKRKEKKIN